MTPTQPPVPVLEALELLRDASLYLLVAICLLAAGAAAWADITDKHEENDDG